MVACAKPVLALDSAQNTVVVGYTIEGGVRRWRKLGCGGGEGRRWMGGGKGRSASSRAGGEWRGEWRGGGGSPGDGG